MIATGKSNNNLHEVTFDFKAGEKCFCCTKVFNKKTKVVIRSISNLLVFIKINCNLALWKIC
jgi:hypothetical protein